MITKEDYTFLVKKYIDMVFRLALSYTKNIADAEDISQDVFLILLRKPPEFETEAHTRFWLVRTTVNQCKKWQRTLLRRRNAYEAYAAAPQDASQQDREVLDAVMALPRKYRMPIYLYYYEEYSTSEIAEIMQIPKGTVCTYLQRGRQQLKLELQEEIYE